MAEITKKDIFDTLTEFYGKMIEPEFRAIRSKLDEHDQRFKDLLDHLITSIPDLIALKQNLFR